MWYQPDLKFRRNRIFINVSSLIDVLFLLLIFFALSTSFDRLGSLEVDLPWAKTSSPQRSEELVHEVVVYSDGVYALDGKRMPLTELIRVIRAWQPQEKMDPVILKADKQVPYGTVIDLLDELRGQGILRVQALTRTENISHEN